MRKSIILAGVLIAALVAVPAFASVQNVKVSGSIDSTWLQRNNFGFGSENRGGAQDNEQLEDQRQSIFFTQTTLQVDADLTDQVSTTIGLINERAWQENTNDNDAGVDLYLAYVTLREMLYSPLTVIVGKQVFSYGNSLIVDATGVNNVATSSDTELEGFAADFTKQTSLDAIRLIFDYNPLTVELLYSKLAENTVTSANDSITDDQDLYGIYTTYELGDDMDTVVEAYFFARIDQTPNDGGDGEGTKSDTLYVPGLRASANVLDGLNIQGEVAWQRGNNVSDPATQRDNERRDAIAAQFISNYQVPDSVLPDVLQGYSPVIGYTFTHVSGDSNPADRASAANAADEQNSANVDTAWDQALEAQGGGTIYNALFDLTNLQIHSVSLTANPIEDVTAKVSWHGLWLDKYLDDGTNAATTFALNNVIGNASTPTIIQAGRKAVGSEIDVDATYDYTEDVQIGASLGWFIPGSLFAEQNDSVARQAIVHGNVNF